MKRQETVKHEVKKFTAFELIRLNWPIWTFILGVFFAVFVLYLRSYIDPLEKRISLLENADLATITKDVAVMKNDIGNIKDDLAEIKETLNRQASTQAPVVTTVASTRPNAVQPQQQAQPVTVYNYTQSESSPAPESTPPTPVPSPQATLLGIVEGLLP